MLTPYLSRFTRPIGICLFGGCLYPSCYYLIFESMFMSAQAYYFLAAQFSSAPSQGPRGRSQATTYPRFSDRTTRCFLGTLSRLCLRDETKQDPICKSKESNLLVNRVRRAIVPSSVSFQPHCSIAILPPARVV